MTYNHDKVMAATTDIEALHEAEEALVRDIRRRLNMIPAGRAGYCYLRRARLVAPISEDTLIAHGRLSALGLP